MTYSALLQRLRRALAKEGLRLRTNGPNESATIWSTKQCVVAYHCDIDRLAAEMGGRMTRQIRMLGVREEWGSTRGAAAVDPEALDGLPAALTACGS